MKKECEFHFQGSLRKADAFPVVACRLLFAGYFQGNEKYIDILTKGIQRIVSDCAVQFFSQLVMRLKHGSSYQG